MCTARITPDQLSGVGGVEGQTRERIQVYGPLNDWWWVCVCLLWKKKGMYNVMMMCARVWKLNGSLGSIRPDPNQSDDSTSFRC